MTPSFSNSPSWRERGRAFAIHKTMWDHRGDLYRAEGQQRFSFQKPTPVWGADEINAVLIQQTLACWSSEVQLIQPLVILALGGVPAAGMPLRALLLYWAFFDSYLCQHKQVIFQKIEANLCLASKKKKVVYLTGVILWGLRTSLLTWNKINKLRK